MPRFHLHIRTPAEFVEDEEGIDFPDYAAAIAEAIKGARSLMSSELARGTLCLNQSIEIRDARGFSLTTVRFSEAVKLVDVPKGSSPIQTNDNRL